MQSYRVETSFFQKCAPLLQQVLPLLSLGCPVGECSACSMHRRCLTPCLALCMLEAKLCKRLDVRAHCAVSSAAGPVPAQPFQASHPEPVCQNNTLQHTMYGLEGPTQAACYLCLSCSVQAGALLSETVHTLASCLYIRCSHCLLSFWCPDRRQAASSCLHQLGAWGSWADDDTTGLEGSTSPWQHKQPHSVPWYPWAAAGPVPRSHSAAGAS